MEKIKSWINALGFPIVCCLLLLYVVHNSIANNTKALNDLNCTVSKLCVLIDTRLADIRKGNE